MLNCRDDMPFWESVNGAIERVWTEHGKEAMYMYMYARALSPDSQVLNLCSQFQLSEKNFNISIT